MSTTVGDLNVKLNLELSRLDAQITTANKKIANMGRRMNSDISKAARAINVAIGSLGVGVGVGALVGFGKEILSLGGKINDFSMQAGIGTDAFQTLAAVGKDSGVTGEQITMAFTRLGSSIQEAAEGSKTAVESLEKLNLTAAGLKALRPEEQFEAIAIAITQATDKEKAFNAALEILGSKTAPKLREVLERLGKEGFAGLSEDTKNLRFSPEQIKTLDEAGDKLQRITDLLKILSAKKVLEFSDTATRIAKRISENKTDAFFAAVSGPAAWWLYGKETIGEQAARGGGSTRNPGRSRSPQIGKLTDSQSDILARMAAADNARTSTVDEKLESFFDAVEEGSEKLNAGINDKLNEFFYYFDNPPDMSGTTEELDRFFTSVENGSEKLDTDISNKLTDFFYTIDNPPTGMENWTRYQEGMFEIFNSIGDRSAAVFSQMVRTGENALDSLVDSVADAFLQLAFRMGVINPLLNSVFGLTGAAVMPAFFGVGAGKAGGGMVSPGTAYPVGENGIEIFSPNTQGTIIPNHKLGGGGGGTYYNIDARGATQDAIGELRTMMSAMNASIEPRSVAAVRDADRRRK